MEFKVVERDTPDGKGRALDTLYVKHCSLAVDSDP